MLIILQAYVYFIAVVVTGAFAYDNGKGLKPIKSLIFGLFFPISIPFAFLAALKVTK